VAPDGAVGRAGGLDVVTAAGLPAVSGGAAEDVAAGAESRCFGESSGKVFS
jgi:hypothetical protein